MKTAWAGVLMTLMGAIGWNSHGMAQTARETRGAATRQVPTFQVDPAWPKPLPNGWALALVTDVKVDGHDNIWILHRFRQAKPGQKAAPPVVEFDNAGNFLQAWGGPGPGYEWPDNEHSIFVDNKENVWIGGECKTCNQLLKFTRDGKLLMQIGHAGVSAGITDTKSFVGPTDTFLYAKTNELFVGDTGAHGRVVVIDPGSGAFKRMWGGYGKPPTAPGPDEHPNQLPNGGGRYAGPDVDDGGHPPQMTESHCVRVSNDGFVYVCDGPNKRFQVFTVDGKFVTEKFVNPGRKPKSTATGVILERPRAEVEDEMNDHHETSSRIALSTDPEQKWLYVEDRSRSKILILERKTLEIVGEFGDGPGRAPGQLYILHDLAVDSHGNVYTSEVNAAGNRRVQKFVFKGLAPATAAHP